MIRRVALAAGLIVAAPAIAAPTLDAGYGSHMVLQRGQPIVVAGTAVAHSDVSGDFGGDVASTKAGPDGRFTLTFPARQASTTGTALTLADSTGKATWQDILVGDVWLCSGQSNMELSVARALNTYGELRLSADDGIRLVMVEKATAVRPQRTFAKPTAWAAAAPATVEPFSAACYFMAKQLRSEHRDVPQGLIHSNWGGSAARAWLDPVSVRSMFGQTAADQLQLYDSDPLAAAQAFVPQWFDWWRKNDRGREPWTNPDSVAWTPVPKISFWNDWTGSGLDKKPVANVWLRKDFDLTREQAAGGLLSIGALDDLDLTWVNGRPVGYTFGWGVERNYKVPAGYLKPGRNTVLIAVNNSWDSGGFYAGPDRLFFTPKAGAVVPLGDGWRYSIGTVEGVPPRAPWDSNAGLGVMSNGMVAPLGSMRLAGVVWYQGESDVGQPGYNNKLRELFAGWRRQFGAQVKMLVVQLADFGARNSTPVESGWAQLRQDQIVGVKADANAAMVTAIDIGEATDIHPANKNDLGKRLAMAAQGKAMPMPQSAVRSGDAVVVSFLGVEGELKAMGGAAALGFELCDAGPGTCRWVTPRIDGTRVLLPTGGESATRVRYAWSDAPIVNLYDGRGLPVPGFELPIGQ